MEVVARPREVRQHGPLPGGRVEAIELVAPTRAVAVGDASGHVELVLVHDHACRSTATCSRDTRAVEPPVARRIVDEHLVVGLLGGEVVVLEDADGVDEPVEGHGLEVVHGEARGGTGGPGVGGGVVHVDVRAVLAAAEEVELAAHLHVAGLVSALRTGARLPEGTARAALAVDGGPLPGRGAGRGCDADVVEGGAHRDARRGARDDDADGRGGRVAHALQEVALQRNGRTEVLEGARAERDAGLDGARAGVDDELEADLGGRLEPGHHEALTRHVDVRLLVLHLHLRAAEHDGHHLEVGVLRAVGEHQARLLVVDGRPGPDRAEQLRLEGGDRRVLRKREAELEAVFELVGGEVGVARAGVVDGEEAHGAAGDDLGGGVGLVGEVVEVVLPVGHEPGEADPEEAGAGVAVEQREVEREWGVESVARVEGEGVGGVGEAVVVVVGIVEVADLEAADEGAVGVGRGGGLATGVGAVLGLVEVGVAVAVVVEGGAARIRAARAALRRGEHRDRIGAVGGAPDRAGEHVAVGLRGDVEGDRPEVLGERGDVGGVDGPVGVALDAVELPVEARGEQVALQGAAVGARGVLAHAVGGGLDGEHARVVDAGVLVVALDGVGEARRHRRPVAGQGVGAAGGGAPNAGAAAPAPALREEAGAGGVGADGAGVTAVVAGPGDEVEAVPVVDLRVVGPGTGRAGLARDPVVGGRADAFVGGVAAPAGVGAVVPAVELAVLREHDVVEVAEARRVHLDGSAGHEFGLVEAVVAAEGVAHVGAAGSGVGAGGVVEGGQVVLVLRAVFAPGLGGQREHGGEVDREYGRRERVLGGEGEVVGGGAGVGVAALREVEGVAVEGHAVGGVVLLRAGQPAHEVEARPAAAGGLGETVEDAGVGVQVEIGAASAPADAVVGARDVEHGLGGGAGDEDPGDLALDGAVVHRAVEVLVVEDLLDDVDRLGGRDAVGAARLADGEGLDGAVLLAHVEAPVGPELQRGGVVEAGALEAGGIEVLGVSGGEAYAKTEGEAQGEAGRAGGEVSKAGHRRVGVGRNEGTGSKLPRMRRGDGSGGEV